MAQARRRKLLVGDLCEIEVDGGFAYVQYVGRHDHYGDAIWVRPKVYRTRAVEFANVADERGYLTFYPLHAAVLHGLTQIVASLALPKSVDVPRRYRRVGARARDGTILSWVIKDNEKDTLRYTLSDSEKKLPIAAIWNHEMLCRRIESQWNPESVG